MLANILRPSFVLFKRGSTTCIESVAKRSYSWFSRVPHRIINENGKPHVDKESAPSQEERRRNRKRVIKLKDPDAPESVLHLAKDNCQRKYTILKDTDPLLSKMMLKVKTRKLRHRYKLTCLEGKRLINDALQARMRAEMIFFARSAEIEDLPIPERTMLYKMPYKVLNVWSNLETSPGILGIFEMPDMSDRNPEEGSIPLTIICDNIRITGNLGSIVRAAAAVGCEKLILLKGCTDLWEPKELRAGAGGHFRMPIFTERTWEDVFQLTSPDSAVYITDSVLVPNDNTGYNKEDDNVESRELRSFLSRLPVQPYYNVNYTLSETVLVLSGETNGLSVDAKGVLEKRCPIRVHIPLSNRVDSLNAAMALSLVCFEVKKQFELKRKEVLREHGE